MRRRPIALVARVIPLVLSLVLLIPFVPTGAPVTAAPVKDVWMKVQAKHFTLIGNAKEKEIRRVGTQLEQFRYVFTSLLPKARLDDSVPTTVIVFKDDGAYKPYKPTYNGKTVSVAGYFVSDRQRNFITLTPNPGGEYPFGVIFHELVHLIVRDNMKSTPLWLNEGLAEYYATLLVKDGDRKIELGNAHTWHLLRLREEKLMPIQALFDVDHRSPEYNERDKQGVFYAQSWALVHFFMTGDRGKRRQQFGKFLNLLNTGLTSAEAFQTAFKTDLPTLEKELTAYIRGNQFFIETATAKEPLVFDGEMTAEPYSEADATATLGDLLLMTGRKEEAEAHVKKALALDPNCALASATLGGLRLRQDRFDEATAALKQAVTSPTATGMTHFQYAYLLTRRFDGSEATADLVRRELAKAVTMMPNYAEAYSLLAYVNLAAEKPDLDSALAHARKAVELAPGRKDFTLNLGQVHLRRKDFDEVRRLLEPIAREAADPIMRIQAADILSNATAYEAALARGGKEVSDNVILVPVDGGETSGTSKPGVPYLKRRAGLERVEGTLDRFECTGGKIFMFVKFAGKVLKLRVKSFADTDFVAHVDGFDSIGCSTKLPNPIVVMYRPEDDTATSSIGDVETVEILPIEK